MKATTLVLGSLFAVTIFSSCAKSVKLTPLAEAERSGRIGRSGMKVSLPKTMVTVKVAVKRSRSLPGQYAELSVPFVGIEPYRDELQFGIGEASLGALGKRDDRQTYWAAFPGGPFTDNEVTLTLNEEGVLTNGIGGQANKTVDFIVSTVEAAGKIGGTVAKGVTAQAIQLSKERGKLAKLFLKFKSNQDKVFADSQLQDDIERLASDPNASEATIDTTDKKTLEHWRIWQTVSSEFDKLIAVAKEIDDLQGRLKTVRTTPFGSTDVRNAAISDLQGELNKLLKLFVGTKEETVWPGQWTLEPSDFTESSKSPGEPFHLFTIIEEGAGAGLHNLRGGAEPPLPPGFVNSTKVSRGDPVLVQITGQKPSGAKIYGKLNERHGSRSFRYRVPAESDIIVLRGDKTLARRHQPIAQYGLIAYLPQGTGSAYTKWDITLDPITGALTKLSLNNKAFDPGLVKQVGNGVNDLVTGIAAGNANDDEVAAATRKVTLLKAKIDARNYERQLNQKEAAPE